MRRGWPTEVTVGPAWRRGSSLATALQKLPLAGFKRRRHGGLLLLAVAACTGNCHWHGERDGDTVTAPSP